MKPQHHLIFAAITTLSLVAGSTPALALSAPLCLPVPQSGPPFQPDLTWTCNECAPSLKSATFVADDLARPWRRATNISKDGPNTAKVGALSLAKGSANNTYFLRIDQTEVRGYDPPVMITSIASVYNEENAKKDIVKLRLELDDGDEKKPQILVVLPVPVIDNDDCDSPTGDRHCTKIVSPLIAKCSDNAWTFPEQDCTLIQSSAVIDPTIHLVVPKGCKTIAGCTSSRYTLKLRLALDHPLSGLYAEIRDQEFKLFLHSNVLLGSVGDLAPVTTDASQCANVGVSASLKLAKTPQPNPQAVDATLELNSPTTVDGLHAEFFAPKFVVSEDKLTPASNPWSGAPVHEEVSVSANVPTFIQKTIPIPWGWSTDGKCYYRPCVYVRLRRATTVINNAWLKNEYTLVCQDVESNQPSKQYCDNRMLLPLQVTK